MGTKKNDILQGTLVLLILKTLAGQKHMHGYAITAYIHAVSDQLLRVEEGSLYPALHRMEQAREESRGAFLFADTARPQTARRRTGKLGAADVGRWQGSPLCVDGSAGCGTPSAQRAWIA